MKIVPTNQSSENLDQIARNAMWDGIRKYCRLKTSPKDPYTDIYYISHAVTLGVLAFAMQETQDPQSPIQVIKIVDSAVTNAIKDWNDTDVTKKPSKN